jgi:hypothetical protein
MEYPAVADHLPAVPRREHTKGVQSDGRLDMSCGARMLHRACQVRERVPYNRQLSGSIQTGPIISGSLLTWQVPCCRAVQGVTYPIGKWNLGFIRCETVGIPLFGREPYF